MSNLLLLADVASKNSPSKVKTTVDAGVQTEFWDSFGNAGRPFFQPFSAGSLSNNETNGNAFDLPNLPPLHDYVKQTEFDYLVNSTHDYYNRIAPPDRELEHSYAVFGDGTSDAMAIGNSGLDDGCFESIANLDEYMGITTQTRPDQSLLCEEVVADESLLIADVNAGQNGTGADLFEQLSIGSVDEAVVYDQLDDLDVDALIQYIWPPNEQRDNSGDESAQGPSNNNRRQYDRSQNVEEQRGSWQDNGDFVIAADQHPNDSDDNRITGIRCKWLNCGRLIEGAECNSFEQHIKKDHIGKRMSGSDGESRFNCLWGGCDRTSGFSHRYQLLRHLRSHTLEAPFACSICNRSFKTKDLLNVHERRAHNRPKKYSCNVCSKAFASTGDLSRHRRIHKSISESNYACKICRLLYKDESGLRKHRARVHSTDGTLATQGLQTN